MKKSFKKFVILVAMITLSGCTEIIPTATDSNGTGLPQKVSSQNNK